MGPDFDWLAEIECKQLAVVHDCVAKFEVEALVVPSAELLSRAGVRVHIEDSPTELGSPISELIAVLAISGGSEMTVCLNHSDDLIL